MKILIIPCGIGMGHTTRSIALAQKLEKKGAEVLFASYGSGYHVLNEYTDYNVVKLPDIKFYGGDGELNLKHTARKSIDVPYIFLKSIYHESRIIKDFRPDIVVSDSHYSVPITCKVIGIPCVMISNDLSPNFSNVYNDRTMDYLENGLQRFIKDVSRLCDSIIIPDIKNSCEVPYQIRNKVHYTGPLLKMDPETMLSKNELRDNFGFSKSEKVLLATVGGTWFGKKLLKLLYHALPGLDCDRIVMVTGPQIKMDFKFDSPKIICKQFLWDMMEWMKISDLVISLAGHSTSMEIASLGIPNLMVPIENHHEQLKNAKMMQKLGISHVENMGTLSTEKLSTSINHLLTSDDLREGAFETQKIFREYKGRDDAVQIITDCIEGDGKPYNL